MAKTWILLALTALVTSGCGPSAEERADERADTGYDDGYAVGYNTTCKIRATLIEGDFENEAYANAYEDGYAAGAHDCRAKTP